MVIKCCSDVFRLVIIVITLYVQSSHGLIESNMDKEKHGEFFLTFFSFSKKIILKENRNYLNSNRVETLTLPTLTINKKVVSEYCIGPRTLQ